MKNEKMKTPFIVLGILVTVLSCCFLSFYMAIKPTPGRSQLCKDLSEFIEWTKCVDLGATYTVLEVAFPPYQTAREEVRNALGNYYVDSDETSYGSRDYYELDRTLLGELLINEAYAFNFDEAGKLLDIRYYD